MKRLFLMFIWIILTKNIFAQIDVSIDDYNEAVKIYNTALADVKAERYSDAIPKLKNTILLNPTMREAYIMLIKSYTGIGQYTEQQDYLTKAKLIFEEDDEFFYYSGLVYQKLEKYDDAIREYSNAVTYAKKNGEDYPIVYSYYANRGICYLKNLKYKEALQDFDYAIKLNNTKSFIYSNRGYALYKLNNKTEACVSWKKAAELGDSEAKKQLTNYCN